MYPYTHALVAGGIMGTILFPHDFKLQLVAAVSAVLPDVIALPLHVEKIVQRKRSISEKAATLREASHSIPILLLFLIPLATLHEAYVNAFLLGWASHIYLDVFTHNGADFEKHDASYLWPLGHFGVTLKVRVGTWDYRYPYAERLDLWMLVPKAPEIILNVLAIWLWTFN